MVTHDTRLIDKCDRIFMMEDGVLKEKNNQKVGGKMVHRYNKDTQQKF